MMQPPVNQFEEDETKDEDEEEARKNTKCTYAENWWHSCRLQLRVLCMWMDEREFDLEHWIEASVCCAYGHIDIQKHKLYPIVRYTLTILQHNKIWRDGKKLNPLTMDGLSLFAVHVIVMLWHPINDFKIAFLKCSPHYSICCCCCLSSVHDDSSHIIHPVHFRQSQK